MARVNIFIGEDLLQDADAEARRLGMKRSAFFRRALTRHLEELKRSRDEEEARHRMGEACRKMSAVAEKLGEWDPVGVIRDFRDRRHSDSDVTHVQSPSRTKKS